MRVVEEGVRLSQSRLWALQRTFFANQDPLAWTLGPVPSYITSNTYIARACARVAAAFIDDCAAGKFGPIDPKSPIPIVELGCGSGRFAFAFERELTKRQPALPFRFLATDFDETQVEALRTHPSFAGGQVEFAVFDAEKPALPKGFVKNPMFVVANYVLDSLPADAYEMQDGVLHESTLRVECPADLDSDDPNTLPSFEMGFERGEAVEAPYGDKEFDALLRAHADRATNGHFLFPITGLRLMRKLHEIARGKWLILASDRGHVHEEDLVSLQPPKIERHGSFSLDVNFHKYAQHARATGGSALAPPHHPTHLATVGLMWGDSNAIRTRQAYAEFIAEGGPEDLYLAKETLEAASSSIDLEHGLSWLRTCAWDFEVFLLVLPGMLRTMDDEESTAPMARQDALDAARRVRAGYYAVEGDPDVEGALAELFETLDAMREAAECYRASIGRSGATAPKLHRLAVCESAMHRLPEALAAIENALSLEPTYEPARAMRLTLQGELRRRQ